jgi:hypothetical protein
MDLPEKEKEVFKKALATARSKLKQLESEERDIGAKKAELLRTIAALAPLCGEQPPLAAMTLANAIRTVILTFRKPMRPKEVRNQLVEMGYDFSEFKNPLASISTAMKRMEETGELVDFDKMREKL